MMKRVYAKSFLSLLLAVVLLMSTLLTACDSTNSNGTSTSDQASEEPGDAPASEEGNEAGAPSSLAKNFSVQYETQGGRTDNPTSYTEGTVTKLADATREGYTFDGWYLNGTKITEIPANATGDLVISARWTPTVYPITYEGVKNGASNPNPTSYTVEDGSVPLADLSLNGYTFDGWYLDGVRVESISADRMAPATLTAQWTLIGYTIHFVNVQGATHSNSDAYDVEDTPILLTPAEKKGYTFNGWFTDENCTSLITEIPVGTTGELTLYAGWTLNTYTVTFKDGDRVVGTKQYSAEDMNLKAPAVPEHKGYVGVWESYDLTRFESLTVQASYEAIQYTISYSGMTGAVNNNPATYTVESESFTLKDPSCTGKNFLGWKWVGQSTPVKNVRIEQGSTGDLEYEAVWEYIVYTIRFDTAGGSALEDQEVLYGMEFGLPTPVWAGHTFHGWLCDGVRIEEGIWSYDSSKTLVAVWDAISYTITYDYRDGVGSNPDTYTADETVVLNAPTKDGYTFLGWTWDGQSVPQLEVTIPVGSIGDRHFEANWKKLPSQGLSFVLNADGASYSVSAGTCMDEEVVIPDTYEGLPVTEIASSGFYYRSTMRSIYIPAGVHTIHDSAFDGCNLLKYVTFDEDSVLHTIGAYVFRSCPSLQVLFVPSTVTNVNRYSFAGCINLSFNQYGNAYYLGNAKEECVILVSVVASAQTVTIQKHTNAIVPYAFDVATNLKTVTFDEGCQLPQINEFAFYGVIGDFTIHIPASVRYIGQGAFMETAVCEIIFEENSALTSIHANAFTYCSMLEQFTMPSGVTEIGYSAFANCARLQIIHVESIAAWLRIEFENVAANPLSGSSDLWVNGAPLRGTLVIPEGTERIPYAAFYMESGITSVVIPASVTWIGDDAFYSMAGLQSVEFAEEHSLTYLGNYAFSYCSGLREISLGKIRSDSLTLGTNLFDYCTSLTKVDLGAQNAITEIPSSCFMGCTALTDVILPEALQTIRGDAFKNAESLRVLRIPASLNTIDYGAFVGCLKLYEIYNLSETLTISVGSQDHGYVGFYAKAIYTDPNAESVLMEQDGYLFLYNKEVNLHILVGYVGTATELTLPSNINGNTYVIGRDAFRGNQTITKVTVPAGVTDIRAYAFADCKALTEVYVDVSVANLEGCVFQNCTSLQKITLPRIGGRYNTGSGSDTLNFVFQSVPKSLREVVVLSGESLAEYAFSGCNRLTKIDLSATSIETVGTYAFQNCSALTEVLLPNTVLTVGSFAFSNCNALTELVIPSSVTAMGESVFLNCNNLTTLSVPFIGTAANGGDHPYLAYWFGGTSYSDNATKVPATLTHLTVTSATEFGKGALTGCANIQSLGVPATLTRIGVSDVVKGCTSLKELHITDLEAWCEISIYAKTSNPLSSGAKLYLNGVLVTRIDRSISPEYIGDYVFYEYDELTSVEIPASVTQIYGYAFYGCEGITSLTFEEGSLTKLGASCFSFCEGITSVALPRSLATLGQQAFSCCTALTTVTFGENSALVRVENGAFNASIALTEIVLPNTVTYIGSNAFNGCSLTTFAVPTSLTSLGDGALSCSTLTSLTMDGTGSIYSVVNHCLIKSKTVLLGLASATIPSDGSVTAIGASAFKGMGIQQITIPASITSIGNYAFQNCTQLTSVTFENGTGLTRIPTYAFSGCGALTSVAIPDSVTEIDTYAFTHCTALETLSFGSASKLNKIGNSAFSFCTSLTTLTFPSRLTEIGNNAFYSCTSLTTVVFPQSLCKIGQKAFVECSNLTSATLKFPNDWRYSSSSSNTGTMYKFQAGTIQDAAKAAEYLRNSTYYGSYYWHIV